MIAPDDLARALLVSTPEGRRSYSVVGDVYAILVSSDATAGLYAVIDMHVPAGGGPDPHRHACEETFLVLEGAIEVCFRDRSVTAEAGTAVAIPAGAPHKFKNVGSQSARLLCVVSPAGLDGFFVEGGIPIEGPHASCPTASATEAQKRRMAEIAARYGVELLPPNIFDRKE